MFTLMLEINVSVAFSYNIKCTALHLFADHQNCFITMFHWPLSAVYSVLADRKLTVVTKMIVLATIYITNLLLHIPDLKTSAWLYRFRFNFHAFFKIPALCLHVNSRSDMLLHTENNMLASARLGTKTHGVERDESRLCVCARVCVGCKNSVSTNAAECWVREPLGRR